MAGGNVLPWLLTEELGHRFAAALHPGCAWRHGLQAHKLGRNIRIAISRGWTRCRLDETT